MSGRSISSLIAGRTSAPGQAARFRTHDPRTGRALSQVAPAAVRDVEAACLAAGEALATEALERSFDDPALLEAIADRPTAVRDRLRASFADESGLGEARADAELERTTGQLRALRHSHVRAPSAGRSVIAPRKGTRPCRIRAIRRSR